MTQTRVNDLGILPIFKNVHKQLTRNNKHCFLECFITLHT